MKKSPSKKQKPKQEEIQFKDAVTKLLEYMYFDGEPYTYPPVMLCMPDQSEKPFPFEEPASSQQLIHYNEDCYAKNEQLFNNRNVQRDVITHKLNLQRTQKITTPKKTTQTSRDISEIVFMLGNNLTAKKVSDRISKSHREYNAKVRLQQKQPSQNVPRTPAEKQRLFQEREKFRQNYWKN